MKKEITKQDRSLTRKLKVWIGKRIENHRAEIYGTITKAASFDNGETIEIEVKDDWRGTCHLYTTQMLGGIDLCLLKSESADNRSGELLLNEYTRISGRTLQSAIKFAYDIAD
jgi:hypothetical protein